MDDREPQTLESRLDLREALQRVFGKVDDNFMETPENNAGQPGVTQVTYTDRIEEQLYNFNGSSLDYMDGFYIGVNPIEGTVEIRLAADLDDCTVQEAIENLQNMERRFQTFRALGYDVSDCELVQEDDTLNIKEYVINMPLPSQAALVRLLVDLRKIGSGSNDADSLASQLERMFPALSGSALERLVGSVDREFTDVRRTTDRTSSGAVLEFMVDGRRVYCKVSPNKAMLVKEGQYMTDAWEHALMRPITPKLVGIAELDGLAALFTYGTENRGIVAPEDTRAYMRTRRRVLGEFAKQRKLDATLLERDPRAVDMYNRALAHTLMRDRMRDPVYTLAPVDSVYSWERVQALAGSGNPDRGTIQVVSAFEPLYRALEAEARDFDRTPSVLIHGDAKPENVFPGVNRPLGDSGQAKPSTPEFDLGRAFMQHPDLAVGLYAFARNRLEQGLGRNFELTPRDTQDLQERTRRVLFLNSVRLMAGMLSKDRNEEAASYADAARFYAASFDK